MIRALQDGFYNELLCLGDACRLPGVQHRVKHMLGMLPTDQRLLGVLRGALTSEHPAAALAPLLADSASPGSASAQPTRLLYTLEVWHAGTDMKFSLRACTNLACRVSFVPSFSAGVKATKKLSTLSSAHCSE